MSDETKDWKVGDEVRIRIWYDKNITPVCPECGKNWEGHTFANSGEFVGSREMQRATCPIDGGDKP